MTSNDLSAARLRELLDYDPDSGLFRRKVRTSNRIKIGDIAGSSDTEGYRQIRVDNRLHLAHRLAWLYVHGEWPQSEVDHVNGVRGDNRICNLAVTSRHRNMQNQHRPRGATGLIGVTERGPRRFEARITAFGKSRWLGAFSTAEEAHAAYINARDAAYRQPASSALPPASRDGVLGRQ